MSLFHAALHQNLKFGHQNTVELQVGITVEVDVSGRVGHLLEEGTLTTASQTLSSVRWIRLHLGYLPESLWSTSVYLLTTGSTYIRLENSEFILHIWRSMICMTFEIMKKPRYNRQYCNFLKQQALALTKYFLATTTLLLPI